MNEKVDVVRKWVWWRLWMLRLNWRDEFKVVVVEVMKRVGLGIKFGWWEKEIKLEEVKESGHEVNEEEIMGWLRNGEMKRGMRRWRVLMMGG